MRAPNDPDYGWHHSRTTPEAMLVRAILARAVLDLFGPLVGYGDAYLIRRDAMHFLTAVGRDAKDRDTLCSLSGFDGDQLRRNVVEILEGGDGSILTFSRQSNFGCMDEARAMWAAHKHRKRPAERVSAAHIVVASTDAPAPAAPSRLPRVVPKVDQAAVDRARVLTILAEPTRQKDIIDALADEMTYNLSLIHI